MKFSETYRKLRIESLENRALLAVTAGGLVGAPFPAGDVAADDEPAVWVVNTTEDPETWDTEDTELSLREALDSAADSDQITFDSSLAGQSITLNGTRLSVTKGMTIDASEIGGITISGNGASSVFYIRALYSENSVTMTGLTITGGNASGVYNYGSDLILKDCTISGNTYSGKSGGGLVNNDGNLSITNCTFSGNSAKYGAAIYNNGKLNVESTLFTDSTADASGTIYNSGTAEITNSRIAGNTAVYGGGLFNTGTVTLTNVEISANTVTAYGGAVDNVNTGTIAAFNCTIAGNRASRGGGFVNDGVLVLNNSILSLNNADESDDFTMGTGTFSGSDNVIGFDPGFVEAPVFDSGVLVNKETVDLTLSETSWAIDRGNNELVVTETDAAGHTRIVASWKGESAVDIGAYEYQTQIIRAAEEESTVVTVSSDEVCDTDGQISLREAILYADSGDVVTFDVSMTDQTITLSGTELWNEKGVSIDASAIGGIIINPDGKSGGMVVGGGSEESPVSLTSLTFTGGAAGFSGGGLSNSGNLNLVSCLFTKNSAQYGAGIFSNAGTLTMFSCTVSKNSASADGGGIYNDGILTMTNTLVADNSTGEENNAGGIYNDGSLTMTNCTVSGNYAYCGGGLFNEGETSTAVFYNCIISRNNLSYFGKDVYLEGGSVSGYYTLTSFRDWTESESITTYDSSRPLFTDSANGDYSLAADSQAINIGKNDYVSESADIAGNTRIVAGIVDLGAYEYQTSVPVILTGTASVPAVSYGANRHYLCWTTISGADSYEISWSSDGEYWQNMSVAGTSAVITGLTYGEDVTYKVRGIVGETASGYSESKTFTVCPMDVNGDGDIAVADRAILASAWLTEEGEEDFVAAADINGDGDVSGLDRSFLSSNWLCEVGEDELVYPPALAEAVTELFASRFDFD